MKKKYKYLILTGLSAVWCLLLIMPAYAQRGGGGGGHAGGGGGGGHFGGGGGGFSGGHSAGGFSGARGFSSPHFSGSQRGGFTQNSHGGIRGNAGGFGVNRGHGYSGYGRGAYGHGTYGHGGYGHGGGGRPYGWGGHGGYFYCHGYYGSLYYPYLGLDFGYLPYGYYPFEWGDENYYFSDGLYYQNDNDQYTVVEPPVGAAIKTLPSDAQSIQIDGQQYYELNGVYYSPVNRSDGTIEYQIVGKDGTLNTDPNGSETVIPKIGNVITSLPSDCRKINLNGQSYFVSEDGIYYQEITGSNNNKAYKIVGLESGPASN